MDKNMQKQMDTGGIQEIYIYIYVASIMENAMEKKNGK